MIARRIEYRRLQRAMPVVTSLVRLDDMLQLVNRWTFFATSFRRECCESPEVNPLTVWPALRDHWPDSLVSSVKPLRIILCFWCPERIGEDCAGNGAAQLIIDRVYRVLNARN